MISIIFTVGAVGDGLLLLQAVSVVSFTCNLANVLSTFTCCSVCCFVSNPTTPPLSVAPSLAADGLHGLDLTMIEAISLERVDVICE